MWWILLPILFFSNPSFAQDAVEEDPISLVIENPKIPKDFAEQEKNQTGKIILKATTKVRGYQIIIGEFDPAKKAKFQVHVVDVEVVYDAHSNLTMTARLFDEKSKKLINKVTYEHVAKISYFRELERLMNELFLPVTEEKLKKTEKKIENPRKLPAARTPAPPTESETANVNFKERIMSLKAGVDTTIKEIAEIKKPDKDKVSDSEGKPEEAKTIAATSTNKVESELVMDKPPLKHPSFQNSKPIHKAGLMMKKVTTNSKDEVIDLDTNLQYVGLAYAYQRPVFMGTDHYWQAETELAKVQGDTAGYSFAPYIHLGAGYGYLFRSTGLFLKGMLDVDTLSFTNLPEVGGGVQAADVRMANYSAGAHWAGIIFTQPIIAGVDVSRPMYFQSGNAMLKDAKLSGQSIKATFTLADLYWRLNLKFDYYMASYDFKSDESKLTTSTSGFGVHVNYVF